MTPIIGSRYKETVDTILESIITGKIIPQESYAQDNACYLCGQHIMDEAVFVKITGDNKQDTEEFFMHKKCIDPYTNIQ